MRRTISISLLLPALAGLAACFFSPEAASSGKTYYVAPYGNDANPGTSIDKPLQSLNKAVQVMAGGDTALVRGGIYSTDGFGLNNPTTPDKPYVIRAYPGEKPYILGNPAWNVKVAIAQPTVLDGLTFENLSDTSNVLTVAGSHITIQNCTFKNSGFNFIRVWGGSHNIIQNNYFDTNGFVTSDGGGDAVIIIGSHHNLVRNNYFTRSGHAAISVSSAPTKPDEAPGYANIVRDNTIESYWGSGVYVIATSHDTVIEGSIISHAGEGVQYPKDALQLGEQDGIIRENVMLDTASLNNSDEVIGLFGYNNGGWLQSPQNNRVYNNVLFHNASEPLFISQRDKSVVKDNKFLNNVMYMNRLAGDFMPYYPPGNYLVETEIGHSAPDNKWESWPNANSIYNNILAAVSEKAHRRPQRAQFWYDHEQWAKPLNQIEKHYREYIHDNSEEVPQFAGAATGNYQLKAGSPGIGNGAHLAHTRSAGSNTGVIAVDDPYYFTDGYDLVPGDLIQVGKAVRVRVKEVDKEARTLKVEKAISFAQGDPVDIANFEGAPSIGLSGASSSAPQISSVDVKEITPTSAVVHWETNEPATGQVRFGTSTNYQMRSIAEAEFKRTHTAKLAGLMPGTSYHFSLASTNEKSSRTFSADATFATSKTAGPVIADISLSQLGATGVTVSWNTNQPADSQVFYGAILQESQLSYNQKSELSRASTTAHQVQLSELHPNTTYYFAVQSSDRKNTNFLMAQRFTTPTAPDSALHVSRVEIASIAQKGYLKLEPRNTAQIRWATDQPAQQRVSYSPVGSSEWQEVEEKGEGTEHHVELAKLAPNTPYHFVILPRRTNSTNAAKKRMPASEFTFSTLPDNEEDASVAPPMPSAMQVARGSDGSLTLKWKTAVPASNAVFFGTSNQYSDAIGFGANLTTDHTVTIPREKAGSFVHYAIESADARGNMSRCDYQKDK